MRTLCPGHHRAVETAFSGPLPYFVEEEKSSSEYFVEGEVLYFVEGEAFSKRYYDS